MGSDPTFLEFFFFLVSGTDHTFLEFLVCGPGPHNFRNFGVWC